MTIQGHPQAQDVVLGGETPPPVSGAVLGGLAGLSSRFEQFESHQKLSALVEAVKYGEDGVSLLWRGLEDADLEVRSHAYFLLKAIGKNSPELERGIPLKKGDRIYAVFQSSVSYGDDWYYTSSGLDEEWYHEEYSFYHTDDHSQNYVFDYVSDRSEDNERDAEDEYYNPKLICYCIDRSVAEMKAEAAYIHKFSNLGCEIYEMYREIPDDSMNLKAWVETNQIIVDAVIPEDWGDSEDEWLYELRVLMSLQKQGRFDLLRSLWEQLRYSPLAFIHEYVIDRPCYLRLAQAL